MSWQPISHSVQTVVTVWSGSPSHLLSFSVSAPTGHASTQAPQNVQPLNGSERGTSLGVPGNILSPRWSILMASTPMTSSHTRTHLAQAIHRL